MELLEQELPPDPWPYGVWLKASEDWDDLPFGLWCQVERRSGHVMEGFFPPRSVFVPAMHWDIVKYRVLPCPGHYLKIMLSIKK